MPARNGGLIFRFSFSHCSVARFILRGSLPGKIMKVVNQILRLAYTFGLEAVREIATVLKDHVQVVYGDDNDKKDKDAKKESCQ